MAALGCRSPFDCGRSTACRRIWHDGAVAQRLVVISHASVIPANQSVYTELSQEMDVHIVVPSVWRDDLRPTPYGFSRQAGSRATFHPVATFGIGRVQRHLHMCSTVRTLQRLRPDVVIIEEEAFSLAGWRWSRAARHLDIPYAVQSAENLERPLPRLVRWWEHRVLSHCAWVMARSPAAAERSRRHGASLVSGRVDVVAHGIDDVSVSDPQPRPGVVGFVGRLSEAKGVRDLLDMACRAPDLHFEFVGDGPLREEVEQATPNVRYRGTLGADELITFYRSIAVLAVPSRTTPTWSEQFGRVIIEAQAQGTPVVAYDSGEIPWVAAETSVRLVREGDVESFVSELRALSLSAEGVTVGARGREGVAARFTNAVAAQQMRDFVTSITR